MVNVIDKRVLVTRIPECDITMSISPDGNIFLSRFENNGYRVYEPFTLAEISAVLPVSKQFEVFGEVKNG